MKQKRILLQINTTANWGSTGKIAEHIGLAALNAGWESYIAYGRFYNASKSKLIKVGSKLTVLLHGLESRLFDHHGLASRIATNRLIKRIRQINPDIIHLHNIHGYYLNYNILFDYLNNTDIPVVWTLHDCWAFTGHCAHFVTVGCMRWKEGMCGNCPLKHNYPKSYLDFSIRNFRLKKRLFTFRSNLYIIAVSEWLKQYVGQSFLNKCNCRVIYNGIDLQQFKSDVPTSAIIRLADDEKMVLGVSSEWTASKGLDDFKRLRAIMASSIKIVLLGMRPEQIRDLPEGIIGIEKTQNIAELIGVYASADVFVNPTYADTFPTVNLEALACGIPVITYNTGGSPEAITPETGIVVEQGNIESLHDAINVVLRKGKEVYKHACRKRAEEYFDKDLCFKNYIELYNEVISPK